MAARNRGGIQGAIPWLALIVVTIFAFSQLGQRNRALSRAAKARDDLRSAQMLAASRNVGLVPAPEAEPAVRPTAASAAPRRSAGPVTERELSLDAALQAALEATQADTERLASLRDECAQERARAERLAATYATEVARNKALSGRLVGSEAAAEATRDALAALAEAGAREQAQAEALTAALAREEVRAILLAETKARAQAAAADAAELLAETKARAQAAAQDAAERLAAASGAFEATYERTVQQLAACAAALAKAERALAGTSDALAQAKVREQSAAASHAAAEQSLGALRTRLLEIVTAQLASDDPVALVTGARMVSLLSLSGSAERLLALIDHDDPAVAVAAARGLAGAADLQRVALPAGDAALALMAEDAISLRMAGLALLRVVTGQPIDFEPGASPEARAAAWKKLSQRLGS